MFFNKEEGEVTVENTPASSLANSMSGSAPSSAPGTPNIPRADKRQSITKSVTSKEGEVHGQYTIIMESS